MNLAGTPLPYNSTMRAAFASRSLPLWVTPQEAADTLRYRNWSEQIALELGEWFARIWSMAFAAGYRGREPLVPRREDVLRMLGKMGYAPGRSTELAALMLDNIEGLHRKGCQRRTMVLI